MRLDSVYGKRSVSIKKCVCSVAEERDFSRYQEMILPENDACKDKLEATKFVGPVAVETSFMDCTDAHP